MIKTKNGFTITEKGLNGIALIGPVHKESEICIYGIPEEDMIHLFSICFAGIGNQLESVDLVFENKKDAISSKLLIENAINEIEA